MKPLEMKKNIIKLVNDYSIEYNIEPQFVEKDYYVTKVLSEISKIDYPNLKIVFSGGTSLSKAYNKIKRFSEDIDFRVHCNIDFSRSERKTFFDFILNLFGTPFDSSNNFRIIESSILKGNENKFLSFELEYERLYSNNAILKPNIKIELTFENLILPPKICSIESFIGKFMDVKPVNINCIQLIEVLADKFSALMWRIAIKDRTKPLHSKWNDPTIMRHLHDISACKSELYSDEFLKLITYSFEKDKLRIKENPPQNIKDFAVKTFKKLLKDKLYEKEYMDFVGSMCYEVESISFAQAVESFKSVIDHIS